MEIVSVPTFLREYSRWDSRNASKNYLGRPDKNGCRDSGENVRSAFAATERDTRNVS